MLIAIAIIVAALIVGHAILTAATGIVRAISDDTPTTEGVKVIMSFIVKDDHAPVNFTLVLGEVKDAEGNVIPDAQLDTTVESDNADAVAVSFDAASKSGVVSFGSPGQANITANVKHGEILLGTGAAAFVVTVGDPASISGVSLQFEGLTES